MRTLSLGHFAARRGCQLWIWLFVPRSALFGSLIFVLFPVFVLHATELIASSHSHIATNPDPTTLICNGTAQLGAFHESRELLCAIDDERGRLDFGAACEELANADVCVGSRRWVVYVCVQRVLGLLVQLKAQTILAFMSHGEIGVDEVAARLWTFEVIHASDCLTS